MSPSEILPHAQFERWAQAYPERIALLFDGGELSYGALNAWANRIAHALLRAGVGPERRVGVCLRPSFESVVALLAIHKAGGVYLPIDPDYPKARIQALVDDAELHLTLTQADLRSALGDILPRPLLLSELDGAPAPGDTEDPQVALEGVATAYVFYTSGTTGKPKGIALSREALAFYIGSARHAFGVNEADTALTIAKFSFSISLFDLLTSLSAGGRLKILPREEVMDYPGLCAALRQATLVHIGPNLLKGLVRYLQRNPAEQAALAGLRHVSSGGDFVSPELLEELKATFPQAEIFVIYGCTEIACMGCFYPVPREARVERSFLGRPFEGMDCALLGESGEPVAEGEVGEICFRGPGIMKGYLNRPEADARAFVGIGGKTYFRTGDLGRLHPSGDVEFLGRSDFQIKIRGQRIELVEVESHLRQAPGVREAVVAKVETEPGEGRLVAYLTVEEPGRFALGPVRAHLHEQLPDYMQPTGWVVLDRMPLNENFKIARRALPPPTPANLVLTQPFVAPESPTERALAALWQELLGVPRVGIHDPFLDLGGDSLSAMAMSMLAAEAGIRISPAQLAAAPTIAALLAAGVRQEATPAPERVQGVAADLPDLPPFILRFLHERGTQSPHQWNISRVLIARKRLDAEALHRAFQHLGDRHDALRLRLHRDGERWRGSVLATSEETLRFRDVDLSHLPEEEQDAAIVKAANDLQRDVNLSTGVIAGMALFELGEGRPQRLLFLVHHFAMDVLSWKFFWLEFERAYLQIEAGGEAALAAPPPPFTAWSKVLRSHTGFETVEGEAEAWLRRDWTRVVPLPMDLGRDRALNTNGSARQVRLLLPEDTTQALLNRGTGGPHIERMLMAAIASALTRWQGLGLVQMDRLVHGRNVAPEGLDLSRTLGCLLSYAPLLLEVDPDAPAERILEDVSAQMDAAGDGGTSVDLYRYLGAKRGLAEELEALPRAEVLVNYRGRVDDVLDRSACFAGTYNIAGLDHSPEGLRLYPLAILADLVDRQLEIRLVYSNGMHRQESIEALGAQIQTFLSALRA